MRDMAQLFLKKIVNIHSLYKWDRYMRSHVAWIKIF